MSGKPDGYSTISVYMMADGADRVMAFARDVFGAETLMRMERPDGGVLHAAFRVGDSAVMVSDGTADHQHFPVWLHVYVDDVDATYGKAIAAGAASVEAPSEKGDGDRRAGVKDPAGNTWWIATPV